MQRATVTIAAILLVLASCALAQESRSEIALQGTAFSPGTLLAKTHSRVS